MGRRPREPRRRGLFADLIRPDLETASTAFVETARFARHLDDYDLRENVISMAGTDFGLRDPVWLSRYGNATRLADPYRKGRVFLAGDAAHQHFPAGGVGMNVGIQDAANLAWKLAATLNGWAPEGLLDTYHSERHPVGADLTATSRAQVALMTAFTPEGLGLRGLLAQLITTLPGLNDRLAAQVSSLAVTYPATNPGAHPLTGTRAPDLTLGDTGLFALLRVDRHILLDLTGNGRLAGYARPGLHLHPVPAPGRVHGRPRRPRPPRRPHRLGKHRARRHRPH
jgi:hypothetical protein